MMLTYNAGTWNAIISDDVIVILDATVPEEALPALFTQIGKGDPLALVLDELVSQHGMSFGNLPHFAILGREEYGVRVVVRGNPTVTLDTSVGTEQLSGDGSPTWVDRTFPDTATLNVRLGDTNTATPLPITGGVVKVAEITWVLDPHATPPVREVPQTSLETLLPQAEEPPEHSEEVSTETRVDDDSYDELLFGETRISSTEDAAIRELQDEELDAASTPNAPAPMILGIPTPPPAPAPTQGDHDGQTISIEQLAAFQQQLGMTPPGSAPGPGVVPTSGSTTPTLIVSTGERVTLDRSVVIGRRPQSVRSAGSVPHLVTVPSPSQDISRSHLEIRIEDGSVLATDLDTTNGTRLLRLGKEPLRLQPGQSTLLVLGDQLDLGDNVLLTFEGLS